MKTNLNKLQRYSPSMASKITLFLIVLSFYSYISIQHNNIFLHIFENIFSKIPLLSLDDAPTYNYTKFTYINLLKSLTIPFGFLLIISSLKSKYKITINNLSIILFASIMSFCCVWTFLGILRNKAISFTLITPVYWFCIYIAVIMIKKDDRYWFTYKIIKSLILFGVFNSVMIIWQFFSLAQYYPGSFFSRLRLIRPEGLSYDPVLGSSIQVILIWLVLSSDIINKKNTMLKYMLILLYVFAGILTGSRTFYVLLLILSIINMFLNNRHLASKLKSIFGILALCIVVYLLFKGIIMSMSDVLLTIQDNDIRGIKFDFAVSLFKQYPISGVGPERFSIYEALVSGKGTNPHNIFAQVLSESGILGSIPFFLILLSSIIYAHKTNQIIYLGIIIIIYITGLSIGIFYSVLLMNLLFVVMGMVSWNFEPNNV